MGSHLLLGSRSPAAPATSSTPKIPGAAQVRRPPVPPPVAERVRSAAQRLQNRPHARMQRRARPAQALATAARESLATCGREGGAKHQTFGARVFLAVPT